MPVIGLDQLQRELQALPEQLQRRVLRGAVGTAASVIRKAVIEAAPTYTGPVAQGHPPPGTLKRAIYQARAARRCTGGNEVWVIAIRSGKTSKKTKRGTVDAFYAGWVEYGHWTRTPAGAGTARYRRVKARAEGAARWVPARPFMRPAFEKSKAAAERAMADYLRRRVDEAAAGMLILRPRR